MPIKETASRFFRRDAASRGGMSCMKQRYLLQQFAALAPLVARFHGIFIRMVESMHMPVAPAVRRPAPMNPVPTKNHGLTVAASTLHAINNTPTVIMTWRMMGSGALLSVTVGRPARSHAMMPPSITETLVRPALRSSVATWLARPPDRHRMSSCWLAGDSGNDAARNDELG